MTSNNGDTDSVLRAFLGCEVEPLPPPPRIPSPERIAADHACALKVVHQLGVTTRPGVWSTRPAFGWGSQ